jgi:hypothetical protein
VVNVKLLSRTSTASAKGVVPVWIKCIAPKGIFCRGKIDLDLLGTPAGSAAFRVNSGKSPKIGIKLRPKVWRALLKSQKKRLNLDLTLSFHSAGKMVFKTGSLTVSRARVRQNQGGTPRHK